MAFLLGLFVCLCTTTAVASRKRALKDGDVILGGLLYVHNPTDVQNSCGELSAKYLGYAEAMIFAIEKVNNDSNLLPNISLGYDIRDFCYSSALAMKIAYDFVRDADPDVQQATKNTSNVNVLKPITALVGPPDSETSLLVSSLLGVRDIPIISPAASSVELSTSLYRNFYRTIPTDKWQTVAMADIVEYFNWTYVGVVAIDDSYGRNALWALEKESALRKTFCLAFTEIIPRLDYHSKLQQIVTKIKESKNVKVVLVWLHEEIGRRFFDEVTKQQITGYTWILCEAISLTNKEDLFRGSSFSVVDGSLGIHLHRNRETGFEEHLRGLNRRKLQEQDQLPWWDEFWLQEFNCSIKDPLQKATCPFNLTSTRALGKLKNANIPYFLDAVYVVAHALDKIYRCQGKQCPETWPTVRAQDLHPYLRETNFDGFTGNVHFDQFGDPVTASYDIVNLRKETEKQNDISHVRVGDWNKTREPRLSLGNIKIKWNPHADMQASLPRSICAEECPPGTRKSVTTPQCCWDCVRCPDGTVSSQAGSTNCTECGKEQKSNPEGTKCEDLPLVNVTFVSATGLAIVLSSSCGLLASILFGVVLIKHLRSPIVKASNRELSFLLLVVITGLMVLALLNIQKPTDVSCQIRFSCRYLLYNLCVSILFLKTVRLLSAFQSIVLPREIERCLLDTRKQAIPLLLLQAVIICLTILWLVIDAPHQARLVRTAHYVFLVCRPYGSLSGQALLISINCYLLLYSVICSLFAFKARRIPENFNEAKYIGFSMYILLLSAVIFQPVEFALEGWYVTVVTSAGILISSFGLLGCMFGPKVYVILAHPEQNTVKAVKAQVTNYSFQSSRVAPSSHGMTTAL